MFLSSTLLRSLSRRSSIAVMSGLLALPLALGSMAADAGERTRAKKRTRVMTLPQKGVAHDARSRIKARYIAEQQLHQQRMAQFKAKLSSQPREAELRRVRLEIARHELQMEHLGPQYALATVTDRYLVKRRGQTLRQKRGTRSLRLKAQPSVKQAGMRPGLARAAANRAHLRRHAKAVAAKTVTAKKVKRTRTKRLGQ